MTVHGVPQTIAALEARKLAAKIATPIAARAGGAVVQKAAQANAPRRTGALAASITVEMDGDDCQVGPRVDYARFPEYGTRYMAAQRYMTEAAAASTPGVAAAMAAVYKAAIR